MHERLSNFRGLGKCIGLTLVYDGDIVMAGLSLDLPTAHRWFAVDLNNGTWDALASGLATPETGGAYIHAANASTYHWMQIGTVANRGRGELTVANVYAAMGLGGPALHHARLDLALAKTNRAEMADWDFAFAHDAVARAYAACGQDDQALRAKEQAQAAGDAIADEGDREFFFQWFEGGNWRRLSQR